jgi:hypothetical protein
MPMAQRQGRECADCLGNRRLERRLSLRRAEKHAFHGRGKLLLIGVMQQQKLQWGPLCPRQHCPTAWKTKKTPFNLPVSVKKVRPEIGEITQESSGSFKDS